MTANSTRPPVSSNDDVQGLLNAPRPERHPAAVRLNDILTHMQKEGSVAALRGLSVSDELVTELLADERGIVRSVAAMVAGYTGDSKWVPLLTTLVQEDDDAFVRSRAVEALGYLGAVDSFPLLVAIAEDASHPASCHAVRALGHLGPAAAGTLLRLALEHQADTVRRVAAETIVRGGDPGAWADLLAGLGRADSADVRKSLVDGLGRSRATRAAAPLVRVLMEDRSPEVREAAAEALVALGDTRTIGALYECALYDPSFTSSPGSAWAWPEHGDETTTGGRLYPVREAAAEALLILGGTQAWEEMESHADDLVALPAPRPARTAEE